MTYYSLHKQLPKYTCFQNVRTSFTWFCLAGALLFAQPSLAQHLEKYETEGQIYYEEQTLTGDWNGFRSRLHGHGIHWEIEYFGDTLTHFREGQDTKLRYFGVLASELHIDTDRLPRPALHE